jgi:hypothetical protein
MSISSSNRPKHWIVGGAGEHDLYRGRSSSSRPWPWPACWRSQREQDDMWTFHTIRIKKHVMLHQRRRRLLASPRPSTQELHSVRILPTEAMSCSAVPRPDVTARDVVVWPYGAGHTARPPWPLPIPYEARSASQRRRQLDPAEARSDPRYLDVSNLDVKNIVVGYQAMAREPPPAWTRRAARPRRT